MSHDQDRRGFLRKSFAIVPAVALTGTAHTQQAPRPVAAAQGPAPAAATYQPTYFNAPEWAFLQAAVARLIPADDTGPGAREAGVPEFIDRQMQGPFGHAATRYAQGPFVDAPPEFGYQGQQTPREIYRAGMAAVDARCKGDFGGKTFAQLDAPAQDRLLKALESGELALDTVPSRQFFSFLLQNTKEGYLSDPIHGGNKDAGAWKMIGFPGARADYADWVGRPGVRYPLPPVTINGPQG
ncbi:MAG: gluconate 2-dehydrogenase subunit 3 family protein [Ramlibacter sp.]|nr:gluconate 2-dehydrogenase subunit 3 family protein [Ramlibacter sp.]